MPDDGLREATGLMPTKEAGISDLDSSPVILAITDSVATGNSQQQNCEHYAALRRK
jgi:hypothetical protein